MLSIVASLPNPDGVASNGYEVRPFVSRADRLLDAVGLRVDARHGSRVHIRDPHGPVSEAESAEAAAGFHRYHCENAVCVGVDPRYPIFGVITDPQRPESQSHRVRVAADLDRGSLQLAHPNSFRLLLARAAVVARIGACLFRRVGVGSRLAVTPARAAQCEQERKRARNRREHTQKA
jgi:hypothetical protein